MSSKRGAVAQTLGGVPLSQLSYKCIVPGCDKSFRSDRFKKHYEQKSDLTVLDQARKLNNITLGTAHIKGLIIDSCKQEHTIFLLKEGYSSQKLPTYESKGFKEQSKATEYPPSFKNFLQKSAKISKKSDTSDVSENIDTETNVAETDSEVQIHEKVN